MPDYLQRILLYSLRNEYKMLKEIDVGDNLGRYWLTPEGEVISCCRDIVTIKRSSDNGKGYQQYKLNGRAYYKHRLLAELYLINDNPEEKTEVHHLDFNRYNNSLDNLIWLTPEKHRIIHKFYNKWQGMDDV